jgi:hypothetical protein
MVGMFRGLHADIPAILASELRFQRRYKDSVDDRSMPRVILGFSHKSCGGNTVMSSSSLHPQPVVIESVRQGPASALRLQGSLPCATTYVDVAAAVITPAIARAHNPHGPSSYSFNHYPRPSFYPAPRGPSSGPRFRHVDGAVADPRRRMPTLGEDSLRTNIAVTRP